MSNTHENSSSTGAAKCSKHPRKRTDSESCNLVSTNEDASTFTDKRLGYANSLPKISLIQPVHCAVEPEGRPATNFLPSHNADDARSLHHSASCAEVVARTNRDQSDDTSSQEVEKSPFKTTADSDTPVSYTHLTLPTMERV